MTKASDRLLEHLMHVEVNNPDKDQLVVLLSYEDHRLHEDEAKRDGAAIVPLDDIVSQVGYDVATLYDGKVPTLVIKKAGLLWMAQRALGEVIADNKASQAAPGDLRDPARNVASAFNEIVLAKGNRLGAKGEVLLG